MKKPALLIVPTILILLEIGGANRVLAREVKLGQPVERTQSQAQAAVEPLTLIQNTLGYKTAADVYLVSCFAECIEADVRDIGPYFDTIFKVNINGSSTGFGRSASAISPMGGLSKIAQLCGDQSVNASRRAYLTYSEVNAAGEEHYDTLIKCRTAGGNKIDPSIIRILNQ